MKKAYFIALLVTLTLFPAMSHACDEHAEHGGMSTPAGVEPSSGEPAPDLYAPSRQTMHEHMNVAPTGNADADFALNMIPHHEGAVEMAKVQLEHGTDPELRKLAEDIIAAQEKEIAFMKEWLKKNGLK